MEEVWKDIPNYEGYYQVSNFGRVKSLRIEKVKKERYMKLRKDKDGYLICGLTKNRTQKTISVHRLIAISFMSDMRIYDKKYNVDHINGCKSDNNLENLRIVTVRFNSSDGFRKNKNTFSSIYSGVSFNKKAKKWISAIKINGKTKYLGSFYFEIDASKAYQLELSKILNNNK